MKFLNHPTIRQLVMTLKRPEDLLSQVRSIGIDTLETYVNTHPDPDHFTRSFWTVKQFPLITHGRALRFPFATKLSEVFEWLGFQYTVGDKFYVDPRIQNPVLLLHSPDREEFHKALAEERCDRTIEAVKYVSLVVGWKPEIGKKPVLVDLKEENPIYGRLLTACYEVGPLQLEDYPLAYITEWDVNITPMYEYRHAYL